MNTTKLTTGKLSTNKLVYAGLLVGLSAIGSMIKIQGSIAFDSMPGFFAALFLGPAIGGVVAGLGHFISALTSGFPLTLPMHLIVTVEMALFAYGFGWIYRKSNGIVASIVAIILNGPIAALITVPTSTFLGLEFAGWQLFYFVLPVLTVASAINIILAYVVFKTMKKSDVI